MPRKVWKDENYVTIFQLASSGHSWAQIAQVMGVTPETMSRWKESNSAIRHAYNAARNVDKNRPHTFREYVYARLPDNLQKHWDKLEAWEKESTGVAKAQLLLERLGTDAQMHLFFYALVHHAFNPSKACKSIGITKRTLDAWIENEPGFAELIDQIHWHKKNFYEEGLVKLVMRGDSAATIFAAKTYLRDRGYSEKYDINLSGQLDHEHSYVPVDELDLPIEVRKEILKSLREIKQLRGKRQSLEPKFIEAEVHDADEKPKVEPKRNGRPHA